MVDSRTRWLDYDDARTPPGLVGGVEPEAGDHIGRYRVQRVIGRGGMGVVLAAWDPELDRRIAIKVVQLDSRAKMRRARARLLREAQLMAQLNHPNVVTVTDVGTWGDHVFVAMEYVEGLTLREYLDEIGRDSETVRRVFVAAARGLAAAHDAGLVHRDFKPDNVMVTGRPPHERVVVLDFGLARAMTDTERSSGAPTEGVTTRTVGGDTPLTASHSVMGTPAYMAPEQHAGDATSASDQFAFCVALYEGLLAERPFRGRSMRELVRAKSRPPQFPAEARVDKDLRRLILRGLDRDPDRRFSSMHDVADALQSPPRARRRTAIFAALGVTAVGAIVVAATTSRTEICADKNAVVDRVWSSDHRVAVEAALSSDERPYAQHTATAVVEAIDRYASDLVAARGNACRATHVEHTQPESELDLRIGCLDRRLDELQALVEVFTSADEPVVQNAVGAVSGLLPVTSCADIELLQSEASLPENPALRADVVALRRRLNAAIAQFRSGRYAGAREALDRLVIDAADIDHPPLHAAIHHAHGKTLSRLGEYEPAAEAHDAAIEAAAAGNDERLEAQAWISLAFVTGHSMAELQRAQTQMRSATAIVDRLGSPPDLEAELLATQGVLDLDAGNPGEARRALEQAIALRESTLDGVRLDQELVSLLGNLGRALAALGEMQEAEQAHRRAIDLLMRHQGPDHPQVAKVTTYLGEVLFNMGKTKDAEAQYRRALEIQRAALPPDAIEIAFSLNNLAGIYGMQARHDDAREYYTQAREILETKLGPSHPNVGRITFNVAELCRLAGRLEDARDENTRAVAIFTESLGPDHFDTGRARNNLASVLHDLGQSDEALAEYRASLRILEAAVGKEHVGLAYPLTGIGLVLLDLDRPTDALVPLVRALDLRQSGEGVDPVDLGKTQFALARALWASGDDRSRALQLARAAVDGFHRAEPGTETDLEAAQAWLRTRPSRAN